MTKQTGTQFSLDTGGRIRRLRWLFGTPQAELAEKVGISVERLGRIEDGIERAPDALLDRIAEALGLDRRFFETRQATGASEASILQRPAPDPNRAACG